MGWDYQGIFLICISKGRALQTCEYMEVAKQELAKNNTLYKGKHVGFFLKKDKNVLLIKCGNLPFP